ncbi:glycosyl transferase [Rhabdochromatium marinum]|nr:glycosyl transferase [Rhabdochromatium marinum]
MGARSPDFIVPPCLQIAVMVPCYNEAGAIGKVVADFHHALPQATVYVYDNNSNDTSCGEASAAGAIVRSEHHQGKGFVVRRMFADVDADIYLMVDGDDTYEPTAAPAMIQCLVANNLDMVIGARIGSGEGRYRPGHVLGNRLLSGLVRILFADEFTDMLSGYRVFSRRFVKSFPLLSGGFEIETELTIHALELQMPIAEVSTTYRERAAGTVSKLRTFSDGARILWFILELLKQERPMRTFGLIGLALVLVAVMIAYPLLGEFLRTGLVPRFPTAILSVGLVLLGFLSIACGFILDTVTRGRQEAKRMCYLSIPSTSTRLEICRASVEPTTAQP